MAAQNEVTSGRPPTEKEAREVARRWFDAVNSGDLDVLDDVMVYDVVDHSGLNTGHGGGCEGHKALVRELRRAFPEWKSEIVDMQVQGDKVTIRHRGRGVQPAAFRSLVGSTAERGAAPDKVDFEIVSTVRVRDGKIVEHWANQGPFGQKGGPGWPAGEPYPGGGTGGEEPYPGGGEPYPGGGTGGGAQPWVTPPSPGPQTPNKRFMQKYVHYVIDGENPDLAKHYFPVNFYNHDRAPGEEPGLAGVTAFLRSIYSAFSGFRTTIEEQAGEGDFVVGRWRQTFRNTGPYLAFPATGKQVNVAGITITRVRGESILEEWEARDAVSLLAQMGVPIPAGPLEGGEGMEDPAPPPGSSGKEVVSRYFFDVWSGGRLELIDEIFAPDYVNHAPAQGQRPGKAGIRQWVEAWRRAFPDVGLSVDLLIAEGDRVTARWTVRGTHRATFMGLRPTGKWIEVTGISQFRVEGGRIRESWGFWELIALLLQTGALQIPGAGGGYPGGEPGGGAPGGGYGGPEEEARAVAQRWFDAVNSGDLDVLDEVMAYDVVDHSELNTGHGGGCEGHKRLVRELRNAFPEWKSEIVDMQVQGDKVTIRHRGEGFQPAALRSLVGQSGARDTSMRKMQFEVVSTVRVKDGKIVEHWANQGPFGQKGGPGWPTDPSGGSTDPSYAAPAGGAW